MKQDQGLAWLYGLQKFGMKLGLENARCLCALLGNPERSFASVLVAGTNGKGSVAAMLDAVLSACGIASGLYTSPHLVRPEERIRVGGSDVSPAAFEGSIERVREAVERHLGRESLPRHPTFFEVLTAMAFDLFARSGVKAGILEVGLGGRFDATNIVEPVLSIITTVDLDHQEQLGSDLASIAREKAGIFRADRPALIGERKPQARAPLARAAEAAGAGAEFVAEVSSAAVRDDGLADPSAGGGFLELDLETPSRHYRRLRVPLPGRHQVGNVALAVRAAEVLSERPPLGPFDLDEQTVRRGLVAARWPGRLEWVPGSPPLLLDCAHNPAGAGALAGALRRLGTERIVLLFGAMRDKDIAGMARELAGAARAIVATRPNLERSASAEEALAPFRLASPALPALAVRDVSLALSAARSLAGPAGVVCVAGSIFLVGEVKAALLAARRP